MRGIKAYQQNSIDSAVNVASPYEVTSMLFDGAIKNIRLGLAAHKRNDYVVRSESVSKAQSIVILLVSTLDDTKAEELSQNLRVLYDYVIRSLTDFIAESDESKADSALDCLISIRDGWESINPNKMTGSSDE